MPSRSGGRGLVLGLWLVWLTVALAALAAGRDYYRTPLAERGFSELHERYAPTGPIGHGFGIAGSAMLVVGVTMYSARKRLPRLAAVGRLRQWLDVHIFLCTLGPFLVLLHTTFKFGGLVAIAFWSMAAVVASGVVGRYVYVRIPKTIHGHFLTLRDLEQRQRDLGAELTRVSGLDQVTLAAVLPHPATTRAHGAGRALWQGLRADLARRAGRRRTRRMLAAAGVPTQLVERVVRLADEQAGLEQAVMLLEPFQRLFRYWHLFHLPLAILMFVIVAVHVAVAILFGYGWPF